MEKTKNERCLHGMFIYTCGNCGKSRYMWLDRGVEEKNNPCLEGITTFSQKSAPLSIICPYCNGILKRGQGSWLPKFVSAHIGDDIFINNENYYDAVPVFNWDGE